MDATHNHANGSGKENAAAAKMEHEQFSYQDFTGLTFACKDACNIVDLAAIHAFRQKLSMAWQLRRLKMGPMLLWTAASNDWGLAASDREVGSEIGSRPHGSC